MQKVLVTGINGFVGEHVCRELLKRGVSVVGTGVQPEVNPTLNDFISEYVSCDLTSPESVKNLVLNDVDAIINLAGFASVGDSFGKAELYKKVNIGVHTNLYQECLRQKANPRVIAVSTGAVYDSAQPMPITEDSKLVDQEKTNEYVISKQLMEKEVSKFNELGLKCIIVRPFNHTGPGQLPGFLLPDLYDQITESVRENKPMLVGNLETKRDFTDVRDVALAYVDLAMCESKNLRSEVYNICSERSVSGKEILEQLSNCLEIIDLDVQIDPTKIRQNEIMDIYGSNKRLFEDIAWKPTISLYDTINDFVLWKQSL
jgi:GDP-4-dehydro-6-deoxy-D-mannose reductase